ncbi:Glycogen synthase [Slackia heliotrinireducens]|uniref:Glycosyltransferase n=1 Tax=Slackia heliotrinireducens (strain ATCC 29202 / DSM 20476 / NCTC 11029 / RHS 1) TaxID=471855 RepID=C7N2L3_SLAHD|nr:glycosyltransferase family 4 protein [Slackia heliotrinireducens]ACV23521.1 glycosyltransferase [Slackia heliotrinireducens DSM 20476]VEH02908.1 Glycogen synthase [Slackia heliotrinireducens]
MNILHVSAQRPDSTGSGIYLRETVGALESQGHRQAVVAGVGLGDASPFSDDILFEPVRFESDALPFPVVGMSDVMPYASTRYRDLTPQMASQFKDAFTKAFDHVFAQFKPDIVICHHLYLVCSVLADWFERHPEDRARCSFRGACHNTDLRQYESHGLEREAINRAVRSLDVIFALHGEQAKEIALMHGIDPAKVRVSGIGYNDALFVEDPSRRDDSGCRMVYVGKLWKQKGLMELFGAMDLLESRDTRDLCLELIGGYSNETERDEIMARAESCQVPSVFAGQMNQELVRNEYQRSDVFVLPSFSEGLPLVSVEALACGCKVVMTDLPGLREWFDMYIPDAPLWLVELPELIKDGSWRIANDESRARFERNLADALSEAIEAEHRPCDLSQLSWGALAQRLIAD